MSAALIAKPRSTTGHLAAIRALIWIYFVLLMFEGAMRMLLPGLSNVLLVVRDPFLLGAYLVAQLSGLFPWNRFVVMFWLLGGIALVLSLIQLAGSPLVPLFGFRASFLHVPLIFLIPRVMNERDVVAFGKWFLVLCLPEAIVMAAQFNVGPDHWLNRGIDFQFSQIAVTVEKIRPPGTFTFVLGPALFFGYAVAFVLYSQFRSGLYRGWLLGLAVASTCLALSVSGSRTALAGVAVVLLTCVFAVMISRPRAATGLVRFLFLCAVGLLVASQLSVFGEGVEVLSGRIEEAGAQEGGASGFVGRVIGPFAEAVEVVPRTEPTGAGLGTGSNVGSTLLTGRVGFLLAEGEWPRMVLEMGPFIGFAFLGMRLGLAIWFFVTCLRSAREASLLPMLLFGACGLDLVMGVWGQPTVLGFSVLGGGLCLAAIPRDPPVVDRSAPA